jgi:hypothetical protein
MEPHETLSADAASNVVDDLRLHQRKAFELCAAFYGAQRTCGADPSERALVAASGKARQLADTELKTQHNQIPLETFLAEALEKVIREAEEEAESFPLSQAGVATVDALRELQAHVSSRTTAELSCILAKTYSSSHKAVRDFYSRYLTLPFDFPEISIRIGLAGGPNRAFPGREVAFNGSLRYEDRDPPGPKHSLVTLKVSPASLGAGCLPALPYVLTHEILCHWPQMARRLGGRPNPKLVDDPANKDAQRLEVDPISEGWMDALCPEVLRERCAGPERSCWEEAETAEAIHNERSQTNRVPVFQDAPFIAPGDFAAQIVLWLYNVDNPSNAERDFRRLTCELNTADWDYRARRIGCNRIIMACEAHSEQLKNGTKMSDRDTAVRDSLLSFRADRNLDSLLNLLCAN